MNIQFSEYESKRKELYGLLGLLPDRDLPMTCKSVCTERKNGYTLDRLILNAGAGTDQNPDGEPIPMLFLKPEGEGPFPVVLFSHSHGGFFDKGKNEVLIPAPYMYPTPYAEALTQMGYAVLAIDSWCFGERSGRSQNAVFKEMLWKGQVLWGRMVYDSLRALDWLCARDDIDKTRIAALGMSMGSTLSWWLAALDTRIKVCADICCLTDFDALIEADGLDLHGMYYFVPSLLRHFSTSEINALIAPRAHLATVGNYDGLTPPKGVDRIEAEVSAVYAAMNAADQFKVLRYPVAHKETAEMRCDILNFLRENL